MTRQLRYSGDETQLALDLGLFINGLPVATFELKNSLTKQTVEDAVWKYKKDRNPRERLFEFGRCVAHFAVDDHEVQFCTHLKGKASWFLPFNKGCKGGAGNPENPGGWKTAYLWEEVLERHSFLDILARFIHLQIEEKRLGGRKIQRETMIFPRFHQLDCVRKLVADARANGAGTNCLVQHSAGSGKSNSIAWLAHRLASLHDDRDEKVGRKIRDAEREWINLIVVFGEKEKEKGKLPVRLRSGEIEEFGLKELKREIDAGNSRFPYEVLPVPKLLSKRIVFRG